MTQGLDAQTIAGLITAGASLIKVSGPYVVAILKRSKEKPEVFTAVLGQENDMLMQGDDVAILVQVAQPIYQAVKSFLEEKLSIKAPLYVIGIGQGEDFSGEYINNEERGIWIALVEEFYSHIEEIKRRYGDKTYHLFFAGPAALAFAMGTRVSRWANVRVYNWDFEHNTYVEVLRVPSDIAPKKKGKK